MYNIFIQVLFTLCCCHKCSYHLSSYTTAKISLTIFPMVCLLFPWIVQSITGRLYLQFPSPVFLTPQPLFPLATTILIFIFTDLIMLFVYLLFFQISYELNYMIYFFPSELFNLAYYPLSPSMLLQMTRSHSLYGCIIFHFI